MRQVQRIIDCVKTTEGAGFTVHRPFPTQIMDHYDPFLLLDRMGPQLYKPGEAKGAPDHPHRGFETVTYIIEGTAKHKDSAGHSGTLAAGDVQWMTAGSGVVHSEEPSDQIKDNGGVMHGFQLWVNLPKAEKMSRPRYQDTASEQIPQFTLDNGKVWLKVISGESHGARSVIQTKIPILYLHVKLAPDSTFSQNIAKEHNAFTYVLSGKLYCGDKEAREDQCVFFANNDKELIFKTQNESADFLLIAGEPINEPVARYGPFVMNTKEELVQAVNDYQSGRFGQIAH
jgi:redox-sensitive bicupin YhaK (pirin superfamily)